MNHSRGYYRRMRKKHINRKKKICSKYHSGWEYPYDGMYSKGKIHCSCPLCRGKDWRGRHIKTLQEKRFEDKMKAQIDSFEDEMIDWLDFLEDINWDDN